MNQTTIEADKNKKLGIIAGGGELPMQVIEACKQEGRDFFVIAFENITNLKKLSSIPHEVVNLGAAGKIIQKFKQENINEVLLAGGVGRPAFSKLQLDFTGLKLIARLMRLPSHGDDKVFSAIIKFLEGYGFKIVGADKILSALLIGKETIGEIEPDDIAENDIEIGMKAALKIGELDIGQAVIIQQGNILGVEGAEGTDRLVSRCTDLQTEGLGGVLVKMKKPSQDRRVDLPSIGVHTIENIHASGLRGVAVEAGGSLVINRQKVIKRANELGIFVVGIEKNIA